MSYEIGAKGFVSKSADEEILLKAINTVVSEKTYVQAELITSLLEVRDIVDTLQEKNLKLQMQ